VSNGEIQLVSDEELARQTRAGSVGAFEELVSRYEQRIFRFALNSCHNEADARELTQDTFVRAYRGINQFSDQRFAAWLFAIARHRCIDHHRAAPPASEPVPPELSDSDNPAETVARREDHRSLWQLARRVLPEIQFQALWLRYAEDLSVAEIARALRKTQTHVKVLLFRARHSLGRDVEARGILSEQSPSHSQSVQRHASDFAAHESRITNPSPITQSLSRL
jgi:RNA polymerase sigma-70 factor, ECF subfamily